MRANKPLLHGDITASIINSFFEVHKELGFGFREYIYTRALERLLIAKGHKVEREVAVMVYFRGEPLARTSEWTCRRRCGDCRKQSPGTARPGCTWAALCWPRGDESRGRPRPSFWQESALLSRLLRKSVQATKPAVPVVAVAVPFQSTVQLPFPEKGASITGDGFRRSLTRFGMRRGL